MLDKAPELQPGVAPPLDAVDIAALNAKHEGLIADLDRLARIERKADAGAIERLSTSPWPIKGTTCASA